MKNKPNSTNPWNQWKGPISTNQRRERKGEKRKNEKQTQFAWKSIENSSFVVILAALRSGYATQHETENGSTIETRKSIETKPFSRSDSIELCQAIQARLLYDIQGLLLPQKPLSRLEKAVDWPFCIRL
jgi:hypothetical protein